MSDNNPTDRPESGAAHNESENNGSTTPESPSAEGTASDEDAYEIADPETSLSNIYVEDAQSD